MAGILNAIPDTITPGESLSVAVSATGYSSLAGYTLSYRFGAPTPFSVAGVADGVGGWTVAVTSAQTLAMPRGYLSFDGLVTLSGVVTAVDRGAAYVYPSPLATSQWTAVLASVDAAIAVQTTSGNISGSISVDGMSKSYSYRSRDELLALRAFCLREIARDTGKARPYRILSRFL